MGGRHETVIVGGGQAGLALSYHLRRLGRPHVVLERGRVAERWRSERWDSLAFQFPNWSLRLPGHEYRGSEPEGFASRDEVVAFIERYREMIDAPVRTGVSVTRVSRAAASGDFRLETTEGRVAAANVVVATGPYQEPLVPPAAGALPAGVFQVHSSGYRNPSQLPPGAVLVVGSGASGCQIVEDLLAAGRVVYLSVGRHRRFPAGTGATTCSGGWSGWARSIRRSRRARRRESGRTRSSPESAAATRSTCAYTPTRASPCSATCARSPGRGSRWPATSRSSLPGATKGSRCSSGRSTPTS